MELLPYLARQQALVNAALEERLPAQDDSGTPGRLREAMRYSLLAGGKRLRPILALAAAEAVGGQAENALTFACCLECIHTYSLIHDDLPAMDDDDLRRGRPTCHKQFDEATAILAGDALLTLAFQWMAKDHAPMETRLSVLAELARDAGQVGMVGGQMLDLLAENQRVPLPEMQNIHQRKTGALIRTACTGGARLGGASLGQVETLATYGEALGLAFQMMDDYLDETADSQTLGKPAGSDLRQAKSTYPLLMGLDETKRLAQVTSQRAVAAIAPLGSKAEPLIQLAHYVVTRGN